MVSLGGIKTTSRAPLPNSHWESDRSNRFFRHIFFFNWSVAPISRQSGIVGNGGRKGFPTRAHTRRYKEKTRILPPIPDKSGCGCLPPRGEACIGILVMLLGSTCSRHASAQHLYFIPFADNSWTSFLRLCGCDKTVRVGSGKTSSSEIDFSFLTYIRLLVLPLK